jgi:hypothetical protein
MVAIGSLSFCLRSFLVGPVLLGWFRRDVAVHTQEASDGG